MICRRSGLDNRGSMRIRRTEGMLGAMRGAILSEMWLLDSAVIMQMAWTAAECGRLVVRELRERRSLWILEVSLSACRYREQKRAGHSFICPRGATWQQSCDNHRQLTTRWIFTPRLILQVFLMLRKATLNYARLGEDRHKLNYHIAKFHQPIPSGSMTSVPEHNTGDRHHRG